MSQVPLKARFARRIPDPVSPSKGRERHIFLCSVEDIPRNIPDDPNPREQNIDRRMYQTVQKHLINVDGTANTFHLKNKGITILADRVEDAGQDQFLLHLSEGQGIVDGGHTYELIKANQAEIARINQKRTGSEEKINQFVKIEVLTGYGSDLVTEIAGGLNTAVQVQQMSLSNLGGKFDWIKEELESEPYYRNIAFREGDKGKFDVRDVLALLDLFNVEEYPSGLKHPTRAYNAKESVLNNYISHPLHYQRIRPLLKDILILHDTISSQARDQYNKDGSHRGAALKFVDAVSDSETKPEHEFVFIGQKSKHRLYGSALLPMLGAFRYMVQEDPKTGELTWKGGFARVLQVWEAASMDLMDATKATCNELGYNLNALGKSANHWRSLYFTVSECERQLDQVTS